MEEIELNALLDIIKAPGWESHRRLKEYVKTVKVTSPTPEASDATEGTTAPHKRTGSQNRALHMGFTLLADSLNLSGLDMRALLKPEVNLPWTQYTVKEHLFKPFMHLMTGKESTKDLTKTGGEIEQIWNTLMRELGEKHGIEFIPFPSDDMKGLKLGAYDNAQRADGSYPEHSNTAFDETV